MSDRLPAEHELIKLSETTLSYKYEDGISFEEWQEKSREKLKYLLGLPLELCGSDIQIEMVKVPFIRCIFHILEIR